MIYLVSKQTTLFPSTLYTELSVEDSIEMLKKFDVVQLDSETLGRDAHLVPILTVQFGNDALDARIVVDTTTVDIIIYKDILESKLCIGHNLKFDLQFFFAKGIILHKVFDTMVIEQLLHLGYDNAHFRYSLHDVAERYLGVDLDKSVRGEIIWRGLDDRTIIYAATDVVHLEKLMSLEIEACRAANCINAMYLENAFVPVISYLEWCGIKLDVDTWHRKMAMDKENLDKASEVLNKWLREESEKDKFLKQFISPQLDLFSPEPAILLNWSSEKQLLPLIKHLGFNVKVKDKKTGETKESVSAKVLEKQKGVNDSWLEKYLAYQKASKVVSTYNESYINAINPKTGRIHTQFKQLGAASGRMSCGSKQSNSDLTKYTGKKAGYPQLQNLPSDKLTRASFVAEPGNLMTSCDYSALESRLGADIYDEPAMLEEFLEGSGSKHIATFYSNIK